LNYSKRLIAFIPLIVASSTLSLLACGSTTYSSTPSEDAGSPDVPDGGPVDSGAPDSGAPDSGPKIDAGSDTAIPCVLDNPTSTLDSCTLSL
jgi:hypothetical protein